MTTFLNGLNHVYNVCLEVGFYVVLVAVPTIAVFLAVENRRSRRIAR